MAALQNSPPCLINKMTIFIYWVNLRSSSLKNSVIFKITAETIVENSVFISVFYELNWKKTLGVAFKKIQEFCMTSLPFCLKFFAEWLACCLISHIFACPHIVTLLPKNLFLLCFYWIWFKPILWKCRAIGFQLNLKTHTEAKSPILVQNKR